jgi:hypothetical protein
MFSTIKFRLALVLGAALLFTAPSVDAKHRRDHPHGYRAYAAPAPRVYVGGRFYANRGYFYGGRFWARPYFGVGIGIPFGYGYRTPRGCGYVDGWGRFYPAPCY